MPSNKKLLQAAAGSAGDDNLFVEDVFSNYIYKGNDGTNQIVNGIDLSGEGGLVWQKARSTYAANHLLTDTVRGRTKILSSNLTAAEVTANDTHIASFNSDGFTLGSGYTAYENFSGIVDGIMSWSWRKAAGWFDIISYSGNGVNGRQLPHSLGSTPGMVICKRTDTGQNWILQHKSLDLSSNKAMFLNSTDALAVANDYWNSTHASSTAITLSGNSDINGSGGTYVAYVFGEDAIFGEDGDEQICKMGSFTTDGNATPQDINLGFEPQWFMYKRTDSSGNWFMADIMRGWTAQNSGVAAETYLYANLTAAEAAPNAWGSSPTSSGITWRATGLTSNSTYIYMAIRRPMKVPEAGTEVFIANEGTASAGQFVTGFPVDLNINTITNSANNRYALTRLQGNGNYLKTEAVSAEATIGSTIMFTNGNANTVFDLYTNWYNGQTNVISWSFKRAPKFMDVVCYNGTGSAHAEAHNLSIIPELLICKTRTFSNGWFVTSPLLGLASGTYPNATRLDSTVGLIGGSTNYFSQQSTSTNFYPSGTNNVSSQTYIAYLFGTVSGVSKVGTYTGNATNTTIDCGFSNGARFVLIKRVNDGYSGDWYVYDSTRGITTGVSPYMLLNTASAEVTNAGWLEAASSGFLVNDNATTQININNATYLFLAIA